MTQFEPSLRLRRLRVEKNSHSVYDEVFHSGVNIIRGDNSSGKSTVLNFIFYGLGGDLSDWSEDASNCTRVYCEVALNDLIATVARDVSEKNGQPMEVFGGELEEALRAPSAEWKRYPYNRSSSKESFSQIIFRLMGVPEAAGDGSGNLTLHQMLRLLYADQLSPVENLFKFDGRWDTPALRDAVGRLLCGAQETEIYENDLEIRSLQKEFDKLETELTSLFSVFGSDSHSLTAEWVALQKRELEIELTALKDKIQASELRQLSGDADPFTLKAQEEAYKAVQERSKYLEDIKSSRDQLVLGIADTERFIENQKHKITALRDSEVVAQEFGEIRFETCPVCYEPLIEESEHACHLCKHPLDPERAKGRLVSMINEAALQLRQSEAVLERRREKLEGKEIELHAAYSEWENASRKLANLAQRPTSESQYEIRKLQEKSGYLERKLEDQERLGSIIERVSRISGRKEEISTSISKLETRNQSLVASQEARLSTAYNAISNEVMGLITQDLRRQDSFVAPEFVDFDFGGNKISVDGKSYFSASSRVILKSSFFLGFLAASLKHSFFRHPRFCVIDTIEDKGMELERSHNFQRLIVKTSEATDVEHQIIYATAMIAPELEGTDLTVGKHSTLDDPTLEF